tara:strand:+ start:849 stop:1016 length:168 start_codon:yes stop_codon:yes gene_type:complete
MEKDFDWLNDSSFSDVFNELKTDTCECEEPRIRETLGNFNNDGICVCGSIINLNN